MMLLLLEVKGVAMAAAALAEKDDVLESVFQGKESFRCSGAGSCVRIEKGSAFVVEMFILI